MNSEDGMTTETSRRYTEEFKEEAVRVVRDSAQPSGARGPRSRQRRHSTLDYLTPAAFEAQVAVA